MNIENQDQKKGSDEEILNNGSEELNEDNLPDNEITEDVEIDPSTREEAEADSSNTEDEDESVDEEAPPTYEELQSEVAATKDQLLRSLAEGENIRRRTEREKADTSKYAITNFARQIISVADNLTRALSSVSDDAKAKNEELSNLCVGIEMTDKELINTFEQFNIKSIESVGQKFDHNIHQAMFEVDDPDQPAGMVVQEIQKGYVLHDRLLRPAMVGVSKGAPKLEVTEEALQIVESAKEKSANDSSSAYEKQSEAANKVIEGKNAQLDKEL
jgi:molecular chaperone GrpE